MMVKTKERKWVVYLTTTLAIILVFGFTLRNRLVKSGSLMMTPTPVPTLNLIKPNELGLSEQEYIDRAIADLAQRLNIPKEKIAVIKVESKKWSNTSLGCPEKGKFYAEVITPGYNIILSSQGKTWEYHAGLNKVITCKNY